jgi:acyl dehydratase
VASEAPEASTLQDLVGRELGPSAWRKVEQADIDTFARLSGDHQWIHVDVERARRESPYGTTIAHGNHSLALIDGFRDELLPVTDYRAGIVYGYDRVRFPAPVRAGTRVRARLQVVSIQPVADGWWQMVQRFTVEAEDEKKPSCVADSVVRVLP